MADSSLSANAEIVMGQSPTGETCNTSGVGLPLLNGPTEYGAHHPSPLQYTTDARKRAKSGDILFCVRGSTTGRMNWANREYAIGRGLAAIRHKKKPELQPFVRAVIEYGLPGLLAQATGSTFPNVSADQLAGLWWPPLEDDEQRAIAHILGTLDDKIELNRRMNETLEAIAQALFKSWFVDFDPVRANAEGRNAGLPKQVTNLFPARLVDSTLGEVPEGWDIQSLETSLKLSRDTLDPGDYPEEVFDHFSIPAFDTGKAPARDRGDSIKSQKLLVLDGCVLVSKLNPATPRIWLPSAAAGRRQVASTEFLICLGNAEQGMSRELVYSLVSSTPMAEYLTSLATGTSNSHQRVRPQDFLAFQWAAPPLALRGIFTNAIAPMLAQVAALSSQSQTLTVLHDMLLPMLISGEIRVAHPKTLAEAGP